MDKQDSLNSCTVGSSLVAVCSAFQLVPDHHENTEKKLTMSNQFDRSPSYGTLLFFWLIKPIISFYVCTKHSKSETLLPIPPSSARTSKGRGNGLIQSAPLNAKYYAKLRFLLRNRYRVTFYPGASLFRRNSSLKREGSFYIQSSSFGFLFMRTWNAIYPLV